MKHVLVLILCLFQFGCKYYGTEGGNPEMNYGAGHGSTISYLLAKIVCEKRDQCFVEADQKCIEEVLSQDKMTLELKMNPPYRTMYELMEAEYNKHVFVSTPNFESCVQEIGKLNCNEPAFDPLSYDNIHKVLRAKTDCSEIFEVIK